ncbi:MAG: hypothetical protein RJA70_3246 [Pseudomonadota bacterium]
MSLPSLAALSLYALVGALVCGLGCERAPSGAAQSTATPQRPNIDALRQHEAARRAHADFLGAPPSNEAFGPDPYRLAALPGPAAQVVGLLRGGASLVLLEPDLTELSRVAAPKSPGALALDAEGTIYVAGELEPRIAVYAVQQGRLVQRREIALPGVGGIRDLVISRPGLGFLVEELQGRLLRAEWNPSAEHPVARLTEVTRLAGPLSLQLTDDWLVVNALLQQTVLALPLSAGEPQLARALRVQHSGPLWAVRALQRGGELWVLATGVEDKPLDRTIGSFGNIDSFLYVYREQQGRLSRVSEFNLSEEGVVTPKVLLADWAPPLSPAGADAAQTISVTVAGYATETLLSLQVIGSEVRVQRRDPLQPGTTSGLQMGPSAWVFANPLLDGWTRLDGEGLHFRPTEPKPPSEAWRLGEALFFTTLMAPHNSSAGALSRFTCETCHFEGYVDGRVHATGRGQVAVSTKPLLGLFNNRPHFSRALDADLTQVAHAEFRVAGAGSGTDPWFSLEATEHEWLRHLGVQGSASPLELRRALMEFLMRFTPRTNPVVFTRATVGELALARPEFTPAERRGAELFQAHCEGCHRATASTEPDAARVPFNDWPRSLLGSNAPLVWADASYQKTQVLPYVHERGTRVPSLRRLYKKWPYLTNGAARTLDDLLQLVRLTEPSFSHGGGAGARLSEGDRADLAEFLRLL